jgi:hypothetical protein
MPLEASSHIIQKINKWKGCSTYSYAVHYYGNLVQWIERARKWAHSIDLMIQMELKFLTRLHEEKFTSHNDE